MVDTSFPVVDTAQTHSAENARWRRWLNLGLVSIFFVTSALLLARGIAFYRLGVGERVDHPDFRVLSPSSNVGHAYGIAGTLLMLTNLLYLLRRRFARLPVGSLRAWLDVHVFTGLFGGMLVLFHSAFQVRGSVAGISVGALLVVLVTGIVGRCLYSLSPKPDLERLAHNLAALNAIGPGLGDVLRRRLAQAPVTQLEGRGSLFSVLRMLPVWRREARLRRAIFSHTTSQYAAQFSAELKLLGRNLDECRRIAVSEVRAAAAGTFLRSWRGLHRFAALLMVLVVALHIGVAWYYGFTWVFT